MLGTEVHGRHAQAVRLLHHSHHCLRGHCLANAHLEQRLLLHLGQPLAASQGHACAARSLVRPELLRDQLGRAQRRRQRVVQVVQRGRRTRRRLRRGSRSGVLLLLSAVGLPRLCPLARRRGRIRRRVHPLAGAQRPEDPAQRLWGAPQAEQCVSAYGAAAELMIDVGNDVGERSSAAAASQSLGPPSQAAIADPAAGASDCPRWRSAMTPPPPQPAPVKNCHRRRLPARSTAQAQLALLPTPLPQPPLPAKSQWAQTSPGPLKRF